VFRPHLHVVVILTQDHFRFGLRSSRMTMSLPAPVSIVVEVTSAPGAVTSESVSFPARSGGQPPRSSEFGHRFDRFRCPWPITNDARPASPSLLSVPT